MARQVPEANAAEIRKAWEEEFKKEGLNTARFSDRDVEELHNRSVYTDSLGNTTYWQFLRDMFTVAKSFGR